MGPILSGGFKKKSSCPSLRCISIGSKDALVERVNINYLFLFNLIYLTFISYILIYTIINYIIALVTLNLEDFRKRKLKDKQHLNRFNSLEATTL